MCADGQLAGEFAAAKNFDAMAASVSQAGLAQGGFVHSRPFVEAVERLDR